MYCIPSLSQFEKNRNQFSKAESNRIESCLAGRVIGRRTALAVKAYEDAEGVAFSRDQVSRGFRPFEYRRFAQVVARFAISVPNLFKTKLAKLLWLCDFYYYTKNGESITGLVYFRLPYGPAPDQYNLLLGFLESDGLISFAPHEFESYGGDTSSKELSDRSHLESVWRDRPDGDRLPYSEALSVKMIQALLGS